MSPFQAGQIVYVNTGEHSGKYGAVETVVGNTANIRLADGGQTTITPDQALFEDNLPPGFTWSPPQNLLDQSKELAGAR